MSNINSVKFSLDFDYVVWVMYVWLHQQKNAKKGISKSLDFEIFWRWGGGMPPDPPPPPEARAFDSSQWIALVIRKDWLPLDTVCFHAFTKRSLKKLLEYVYFTSRSYWFHWRNCHFLTWTETTIVISVHVTQCKTCNWSITTLEITLVINEKGQTPLITLRQLLPGEFIII